MPTPTRRTPFAIEVTVSLHTRNPRFNLRTEVRDPAYQRQSTTITEEGNADDIQFPRAEGPYTATHAAIHDWRGAIIDVREIAEHPLRAGDRLIFPRGTIRIDYVVAALAKQPKPLYTIDQAAEYLGLSRRVVQRVIATGELESQILAGTTHCRRITQAQLDAYIEKRG